MKSIAEYIRRIGKARGFGIQSPWAYSFVTEVIGERSPYYAYDDINRRYHSRKERKRQRLYHRVCNFMYGHRLYITDMQHPDEILLQLCSMANEDGAVIIEGIHRDKRCSQRWEMLKENELIGITFDLYDIAICFLDRKIIKQHYKLNF